jgi:LCP family protein required for cell wall assembly
VPRDRGGRRRPRLLPHRPKLRRVLMLTSILLPLLLLAMAIGGFLYARNVFDKIERLDVADVLSPGGHGTNYLMVGSDSRDAQEIIDAGLNPEAFEDGGGQRSDTILVLRTGDGPAKLMSVPRDLCVKIADTGTRSKINAAYQGGPKRLIQTVQQSLGIPVQHYLEVDFVSFARLVDAIGGITIDFPHPAFDTNTGLNITEPGPHQLDGPTALAFVRSRHYVEVIDGKKKPDLQGDINRVKRQQQFLTAVLGKMGESKNPLALARAANSASGGLRIDDTIGLTDAMRLAWKLKGATPESVTLPTRNNGGCAGDDLALQQPAADAALAQFK